MDWGQIMMDSVTVVLVAAAITTVGGFIGIIVKETLFSSKTYALLKEHITKSSGLFQRNGQQHEKRKDEHIGLSQEHNKIIHQQVLTDQTINELRKAVDGTSKGISSIDQAIKEQTDKQKNRYKSLNRTQTAIADSISNLAVFSDEMQRLNLQNVELNAKIELLQQLNNHQFQQISDLQNENSKLYTDYNKLDKEYRDFEAIAKHEIQEL